MDWQRTTFLLDSPFFQARTVRQEHRHLPPFPFIKVVMILCMSLVAGAILLGSMYVEAAGRRLASTPTPNNCTLIVPPHPLTAEGLATPYRLVGTNPKMPCHEANPNQSAFVQAAILNRETDQISVYDPLVVDQAGPAIKPVVPRLPRNAIIALWFGFNGNVLTLQRNDGFKEGKCVDGLDNTSPFGQFAYCNAREFFEEANEAMKRGKLIPPPLGKAADGLTCPSTRDFSVVDQDQSDNLTTSYLVLGNGQTAQNTAANRRQLFPNKAPSLLTNPGDNKLLVGFIDPALDCDPWMVPDLADPGRLTTALPLNELQAARRQDQPVALVPAGDPMVLVGGQPNRDKLNLFRIGVDQPQVDSLADASTVTYCGHLLDIAPRRLRRDEHLFKNAPSPVPAMANNLFTFMAQRFNVTWGQNGLNCMGLLHKPSPISVTVVNGVAVNATIKMPNSS